MDSADRSMDEGPEAGRFVAGWVDGNHAGRAEVLRTFRRTAAPLGWTCDDAGRLARCSGTESYEEPRTVARDNPECDPAYDLGYERGRDEVRRRLSRELLARGIAEGLYVAVGGRALALESVDDLVSAAAPQLPLAAEVTDAALHAFLDAPPSSSSVGRPARPEGDVPNPVLAGASSRSARAFGAAGSEPQPAPGASSEGPEVGTAAARGTRSFVDRRTLVGAGLGAALTGVLWRFWSAADPRGGDRVTNRAQSGSGYVPPTWWDDLPPTTRNFFLAWDQLVWDLEQTPSGTASLHAALQTFLLTPGYDDLKENIVIFLEDSQRVAYHWDLLHGLVPGVAAPNVHGMILAALTHHVATLGASILTPQVILGLQMYRDQGFAPTPGCQSAVEHLLSMVGA